MSLVAPFYSIKEEHYHNDDKCGPGNEIPEHNRRYDVAGMRLRTMCKDCQKLFSEAVHTQMFGTVR